MPLTPVTISCRRSSGDHSHVIATTDDGRTYRFNFDYQSIVHAGWHVDRITRRNINGITTGSIDTDDPKWILENPTT